MVGNITLRCKVTVVPTVSCIHAKLCGYELTSPAWASDSSRMDKWLSRSMLEKKPLHCFSKLTKSYNRQEQGYINMTAASVTSANTGPTKTMGPTVTSASRLSRDTGSSLLYTCQSFSLMSMSWTKGKTQFEWILTKISSKNYNYSNIKYISSCNTSKPNKYLFTCVNLPCI